MKRNARNASWSGLAFAMVLGVAGCKPDAPSVSIKSASAPAQPDKTELVKPLQIPKITAETTAPETPDAPPPPTPDSLKNPPTKPASAEPLAPSANRTAIKPTIGKLPTPELPPQLPQVAMSDAHQKLCQVQVGDSFPELVFANLEGQPVKLPSLYGERLTIVVFWNASHSAANEQFERMQREILNRYGVAGVSVVAVHVGDSPSELEAKLASSPRSFPCLVDPEGEAFQKIATNKLPRTYVLDKHGKILWFDIEYSRSTRRELDNAVHYFLKATT